MKKPFYWITILILFLFVAAGVAVVFDAPRIPNVDAQVFEAFFKNQYVIAALVGLALGAGLGYRAVIRTYHQPRERGVDFIGRVINKGYLSALLSAVIVAVIVLVFASQSEMGPLAPLERVIAIAGCGLFYVTLALAVGCTMITFALVTRVARWGAQYALI